MVLVLAVPLSDPWLPLNALGVPLGGKGTAARAAKSCQGQPRAAKGRLLRQIAVKIHVFYICIFGFSGFRVVGFSGFQLLTLDRGHVKSMTLGLQVPNPGMWSLLL